MSRKYRNPEPPPGYVRPPRRKQEFMIIDGVRCQFLHLIYHSGLFEEDFEEHSDLVIQSSEDEESPPKKSNKKSTDLPFSDEKQKSKRKNVADCNSDSSSSSDSRQKSKKKCCLSPSPEIEKGTPEHLYGFYPCDVCGITLNSLATYRTHMSGRKHQKAVKAREDAGITIKAINPTELQSKYPKVPPGVFRKKIRDMSFIQETVEKNFTTPCPGLEHVTEIRGLKETTYYCHLCDSPCSVNSILSHLKGYKHLLQCLKLYKPAMYEKVADEPKYKVGREIVHVLRVVQKKEGIGKMVVEKDYEDKDSSEPDVVERTETILSSACVGSFCIQRGDSSPVRSIDIPSTSYQEPNMPFTEYYTMTTIPDTSKSDYYCKICESHMNSIEMWESHIRGKRHLTNIKKNPGALPSKSKSIPMPRARPFLLGRLKDVEEPIVGLDHIREVQNIETNKEMYQCFLCGGCLTSINIIEHIVSQKHRTKYLEYIEHHSMETLKDMNLKENSAFYLVEEICQEVEREYGPGCPEVYVTKSTGFQP